MQSISLRSTEPVICLVHSVPYLKEFVKFSKTAKDRQVGLAGGLMRITKACTIRFLASRTLPRPFGGLVLNNTAQSAQNSRCSSHALRQPLQCLWDHG